MRQEFVDVRAADGSHLRCLLPAGLCEVGGFPPAADRVGAVGPTPRPLLPLGRLDGTAAEGTGQLFDSAPAIRVFDADCQAAGIAKTDARGGVVDIHALRTTFCTHLAVAGVHPRVAQQAMRHSRMELTNRFYTDPVLLDVAGAVNSLPSFSSVQPATEDRLTKTTA